jgi:hypothetical protein
MRYQLCTLSAFALLVFLAAPAWSDEAPTLTETSGTRLVELLAGEKFTSVRGGSDGTNRGEVVGLVEAPVHELALIVRDYENIPQWSEALVVCNVISESGAVQIVEGETQLPWPLANRTWRIRSEAGNRDVSGTEAWVNMWTDEEGYGNINDTYGYWMLYPLPSDERYTVVKYVVNADPGLAIPDFVLNWVTNRVLPDLIEGLADRHALLY